MMARLRLSGPGAKRAHYTQSLEPPAMSAIIVIGIFIVLLGLINVLEFGRLD